MPRGSCACGDYTYEVNSSPTATVVCHCTPCQKFAGANGSTNTIIPKDHLKWTGETVSWVRKGDSGGEVTNLYCASCKNLVRVEIAAMPDVYVIKSGTLDDIALLNEVPVDMEIYTRSRPNCFEALHSAAQKHGAPE